MNVSEWYDWFDRLKKIMIKYYYFNLDHKNKLK